MPLSISIRVLGALHALYKHGLAVSRNRHFTRQCLFCFFFFQAEDGIRDADVTGVQTCALPIYANLLVSMISGDARGARVFEQIFNWIYEGVELDAPNLAPYEVINALTRLVVDRKSVV